MPRGREKTFLDDKWSLAGSVKPSAARKPRKLMTMPVFSPMKGGVIFFSKPIDYIYLHITKKGRELEHSV